ncbi:MAG: TonB-dependent receptor [Rhodanobacteraceae bacterium]|nr:MAG: TonB-dependent receptor [Rhodanobacteraceae bacterium]
MLVPAVVLAAPPAPPTPARPKTLQTIVVTGTRVVGRTAADSLAPVDVLTQQDLARTGAPDLDTALRILLPSFNFPTPSLTDATDASAPAQLRGLSPDETLVLVNGKRQHTTAILNDAGWYIGRGSSPVDLAAIPISAIARIEVLRDGAAAQYGSDAIAGVINVILKGGAGPGAVNTTYGQYAGGQGATRQTSADGGFNLGQRGWIHLSGNYLNRDQTNRARADFRYPGDPRYGSVTFHYGLPGEVEKQGALNAQYQLGAHATLYAFGIFNRRNVLSSAFFRALTEYQTAEPAAARVYPTGYLPAEHNAIQDDTEVLGMRGDAGGWHYDVSANAGGNHWKLDTDNTINYSLGAASPTRFYIGTLAIRQQELNADFRRSFDAPWYGPLNVAWGLAYRHQQFTIRHGDAASYFGTGSQGFAGFQPLDAGTHTRVNAAEYVDLETGLTRKLSVGFAARHEHYSDFGGTTVWKLSGRYAPTPVVALRGTVSTGFRAPSLQQEFYSSTTTNTVANPTTGQLQLFDIRTFPVSDPAAIALGAQPLQPEQSRNYGIGLVLTPAQGPQVTLDLYQIDIRDRILLSGTLVGPAVQAYLDSIGIPQVEGGNFFTNAASTRTRGADLVADWPVQLAASRVKFTGGINYNKTRIRSIQPNPPQLALQGLVLPILNRQEQGLITVDTPRTKAFVAADWTRARWVLHGQLTRYGGFTALSSAPVGDQSFPARVLLDASASYRTGHWTFTVGGNNIFNTYPAKTDAANNFDGMLVYHFLSPFGFNGSYWYAQAGYRW